MTDTPLPPPVPLTGLNCYIDPKDGKVKRYDQARADLEAELKQWKNVFGHLGTADECGNEWIRLQDENQRLREALEEIADNTSNDGSDGWCGAVAIAALKEQP